MTRTLRRISVVLPVFNEADVLDRLAREVARSVRALGCEVEVLFVNDGSTDGSAAILDRLAAGDPEIQVLHLSRNFGHQAAVQAGLAESSGDAVVIMDSDLQDDPASLPRLVDRWREGYDVVYAIRTQRKEGPVKRLLFRAFYRLLNAASRTPMPADAGNFGLVDRRVADEIARLLDRDRYYAGLRSWVGFRQIGVEVERGPRYDGRPRVSLLGLCRLAQSALFSFSSVPLTLFYLLGLLSLAVFAAVAGFALYHKLFTGLAIPGWTSITMVSSFFGAMNALGIAVLGEYVSRIYDQVRARPMYLIERRVNRFGDSRMASTPSDLVASAASSVLGLTSSPRPDPAMLAHNVFFTLHDNSTAEKEQLVAACKKYLTGHPGVVFFACGTLQDELNRPVNVRDFDVALHVVFESLEAHDAYQDAPRHHAFVAENKAKWKQVRVFDSQVGSA